MLAAINPSATFAVLDAYGAGLFATALFRHRTHTNAQISFSDYPYQRAIYDDTSPTIVIKKSTQCGMTEMLTCAAINKAEHGRSVFYVLPTEALRNRFVRNRFDRSVLYSPEYRALLKQNEGSTSEGKSYSVALKHVGRGVIAFVGSNAPGAFTEFPADDLIVDELDRCNLDNVEMGEERLSASRDKRRIFVSNPTIEGYAIDQKYGASDRHRWWIKHDCGNWIHPDFFDHVVREVEPGQYVLRDAGYDPQAGRDVLPICQHCGKPYNRFSRGQWRPDAEGAGTRGYHISKMFSTRVAITELVERFDQGLKNDGVLQRFYNGDLGLALTSTGAKITEGMLADCVEDYGMPDGSTAPCVMGIDVGTVMHVRINEVLADGRVRAVYIGEAREYEDVRELYKRYRVVMGVIDAMPEGRLSRRVTATLPRMLRCFYTKGRNDHIDLDRKTITTDRTQALDAVKEMVLAKQLALPRNAMSIKDYVEQMTAGTRTYDEEKDCYTWVEGSKADHFAHAEAYAAIAKRLYLQVRK